MTNKEILNLKFYSYDLQKTVTVRKWLKALLTTLISHLDEFSSKNPMRCSHWWGQICLVFVKNKLIDGYIECDEDGDLIECDYDLKQFQEIIIRLIEEEF